MIDKKVREDINTIKDLISSSIGIQAYQIQALLNIISIAEGTTYTKVSEIEEFPKKKEPVPCVICNNRGCPDCFSDNDRAYNQALKEIGNLSLTLPKDELDRDKLRYILNERNPLGIRLNEQGAEPIIEALCQAYKQGLLKKE